MLLKNGANRDMQDNKVRCFLFFQQLFCISCADYKCCISFGVTERTTEISLFILKCLKLKKIIYLSCIDSNSAHILCGLNRVCINNVCKSTFPNFFHIKIHAYHTMPHSE